VFELDPNAKKKILYYDVKIFYYVGSREFVQLLCYRSSYLYLFITAAMLSAHYGYGDLFYLLVPSHTPRGLQSFSQVGHLVRFCAVGPDCQGRKVLKKKKKASSIQI
jgi:hypothetical protein